ncbi:MAG: hypothetical protein PUK21_01530 [Peptostreptococcaceae bacterium]|nr:hypothetical protein [Peptostreptococcaceae bacterium]MDY5738690.1 hypothetical protein [Anaerovoracaceae bacterium]
MAEIKRVKKHMIALFLNTGTTELPKWTRIKKSTKLELKLDPQKQDYDYISDESATTELEGYKPSIDGMPLTMYKGEPDFDFVWQKFYNLATGAAAKVEAMVVFIFDESEGSYKAWQTEATLTIDSMDAVEGTITFDLPFGGNVIKGTAKLESGNPTFTKTEA